MTDGTTDTDPAIDAQTLDALEDDLLDARGQANAMTSGELAGRHFPDDAEANPATREAVKVVMRERDLPVIGGPTGYYIPQTRGPIQDAIESLEGRIRGIRERQRLLAENWEAWTAVEGRPADATAEDLLPEDAVAKIEDDPILTVEDILEARVSGGD